MQELKTRDLRCRILANLILVIEAFALLLIVADDNRCLEIDNASGSSSSSRDSSSSCAHVPFEFVFASAMSIGTSVWILMGAWLFDSKNDLAACWQMTCVESLLWLVLVVASAAHLLQIQYVYSASYILTALRVFEFCRALCAVESGRDDTSGALSGQELALMDKKMLATV